MLPAQEKKRENKNINRHSHEGLRQILSSISAMLERVPSAEQRATQKGTPIITRWLDDFVNYGFVAPDKLATLLHGSPEKVLILAPGPELFPKRSG